MIFEAKSTNEHELVMKFGGLFSDRDDFQSILAERPLFAHYTSISVVEKIMKNEEVWLSNPLFMNDLEEMRFGVQQGIIQFDQLRLEITNMLGSPVRFRIVESAFMDMWREFDTSHALDTFVFCLSKHRPDDNDGVLSMWRAYGGSGSGAALIFNTAHMTSLKSDSQLVIARVHYGSGDARKAWLCGRIREWLNIVQALSLTDDQLRIAARVLFVVIKIYALTSKHHGFIEENEWRVIYLPERDRIGLRDKNLHYVIGKNGVEPKLKIKIAPLPISEPEEFTFGSILDRIILGPSLASPLARACIVRMLQVIGKSDFSQRVFSSTIPLRPI